MRCAHYCQSFLYRQKRLKSGKLKTIVYCLMLGKAHQLSFCLVKLFSILFFRSDRINLNTYEVWMVHPYFALNLKLQAPAHFLNQSCLPFLSSQTSKGREGLYGPTRTNPFIRPIPSEDNRALRFHRICFFGFCHPPRRGPGRHVPAFRL